MNSVNDKTILVTRPREQADELRLPLEALGAKVLLQPAIEIAPPENWNAVDGALESLQKGDFAWAIFSSANGVRSALGRAKELGYAPFVSKRVKIATVGSATSRALRQFDIEPDLEPTEFDAEGIFAALAERYSDFNGLRFLSFRASRGRKVLAEALRARGATVEEVVAYRSLDVEKLDPNIEIAMRERKIDCATAMSSATAKTLCRLFGKIANNARWIALSPLTADALRTSGVEVAAIAKEATTQGLVDAVVEYFETQR